MEAYYIINEVKGKTIGHYVTEKELVSLPGVECMDGEGTTKNPYTWIDDTNSVCHGYGPYQLEIV